MSEPRTIDCHKILRLVLKGDLGMLIAAIQFMELQLGIQRDRLDGPVRVTPGERRKMLAAKQTLGEHVSDFLMIVTDQTFKRWERKATPTKIRVKKSNLGRPLTPEAIEKLIVRMAEENQLNRWSKTRIIRRQLAWHTDDN
jgi:hypothetical protein